MWTRAPRGGSKTPPPGRRKALMVLATVMVTLGACATQPYAPSPDAPGFLSGLLHGFLSWFALIAHIFSPEIRIYAYPNDGGWYDFGFLLGVTAWGGIAAAMSD
ncbi:hypothetical protein [Phenylobacterium sp.]|jgi:hypothetical protein|uniref:hypothetical protein n=1 Tax=Phenylobacterium sp. TaxID=1871053 RepID=UPI0025DE0041|nr:hypothetical protein [Phenylobacterium sp.]